MNFCHIHFETPGVIYGERGEVKDLKLNERERESLQRMLVEFVQGVEMRIEEEKNYGYADREEIIVRCMDCGERRGPTHGICGWCAANRYVDELNLGASE